MSRVYFYEVMMQERQHELEHALERQQQVQAALTGQQRHTVFRFSVLGRVLIRLGTRLVVWGQRLQPTHVPACTD